MKRIPYPIHATRPASPTITPLMWWMLAGVIIAAPVAYLFASAVLCG